MFGSVLKVVMNLTLVSASIVIKARDSSELGQPGRRFEWDGILQPSPRDRRPKRDTGDERIIECTYVLVIPGADGNMIPLSGSVKYSSRRADTS